MRLFQHHRAWPDRHPAIPFRHIPNSLCAIELLNLALCLRVAWGTAQPMKLFINEKLTVLSTLLSYAGPKGCKLIPASVLSMHVDGMSPEIVAVPAADVAKLIAACMDDRYRVAVLLASEARLRIGGFSSLR